MAGHYVVYMVQCSDGSYYTGMTNNLQRRLAEHNNGISPKSYTFTRRPVKAVFATVFTYVWDAIHFEKQLKGWSRKKKEALINDQPELLPKLSERRKKKKN